MEAWSGCQEAKEMGCSSRGKWVAWLQGEIPGGRAELLLQASIFLDGGHAPKLEDFCDSCVSTAYSFFFRIVTFTLHPLAKQKKCLPYHFLLWYTVYKNKTGKLSKILSEEP